MDSTVGLGVCTVRGRRKVGKTDLVRHFFGREREPDPCHPAVFLNLDTAGQDATEFLGNLREEVLDVSAALLDGFRPRTAAPVRNFARLVEHLLKKNCTVVLDEFQRIATHVEDRVWLPEEFQRILDTLRHERADALDSGWRLRLIVMGSEQQKLMEMFEDPSQPLFDQVHRELHVKPWGMADLAEAAAGMGWDQWHSDKISCRSDKKAPALRAFAGSRGPCFGAVAAVRRRLA